MRLTLPSTMTDATSVEFWPSPERTGDPAATAPVTEADDVWTADVLAVPPGRYYYSIVGTGPGGPVTHPVVEYVDLPDDPTLVVSPETVARKARMPLPLTAEQREVIIDAIRSAQSDVVTYLGCEITPVERVEYARWSWSGEEWNLTPGDDPIIRVLSAVPELDPVTGEPTSYFTVTYLVGLDAKHDPELHPIRRFVALHAMNSPEFTDLWKVATGAKGEIRSVSAEGQSVSWGPASLGGGGKAGSGDPGSLPTMASLDRWRVAGRRVYQGRTRTSDWPFTGSRW